MHDCWIEQTELVSYGYIYGVPVLKPLQLSNYDLQFPFTAKSVQTEIPPKSKTSDIMIDSPDL